MKTEVRLALNVKMPSPEEIERKWEDVPTALDRYAFQAGAYAARYRQALEYLETLRSELKAIQQN